VSVYATTAVWRHSRAKGVARLVLLALADEASSDGEVAHYRRSYAHLAAKANVDKRSVTRAIRDLVDLGELVVTEQGRGQTEASYVIQLPTLNGQGVHTAVGKVPPQGGQDAHTHKEPVLSVNPVLPLAGVPPATKRKAHPINSPVNALADAIARDEWERRTPKPVCGFPAFRARITECLDAGVTEQQLRKVLPTMTVFSRNAFDFALGGSGKRVRKAAVDDSGQRQGPAGRVQL
jgi:hypothetical protein